MKASMQTGVSDLIKSKLDTAEVVKVGTYRETGNTFSIKYEGNIIVMCPFSESETTWNSPCAIYETYLKHLKPMCNMLICIAVSAILLSFPKVIYLICFIQIYEQEKQVAVCVVWEQQKGHIQNFCFL